MIKWTLEDTIKCYKQGWAPLHLNWSGVNGRIRKCFSKAG